MCVCAGVAFNTISTMCGAGTGECISYYSTSFSVGGVTSTLGQSYRCYAKAATSPTPLPSMMPTSFTVDNLAVGSGYCSSSACTGCSQGGFQMV